MFWANPLSIEPTTKITIATWTSVFLLNRSASLPQIGVVAVAVSSVAVTTQVYCVCVPFSEPMIRGSAVETTVELIIATNSASSRPDSDSSTCRCAIWSAAAFPSAMPLPSVRTWPILAHCAKLRNEEVFPR